MVSSPQEGIGIEFTDEPVSIFLGEGRELSDKGLNQLTTGFFQGLSTANIRAVSFHELRIKVLVANKQAELITHRGCALLGPFELVEMTDNRETMRTDGVTRVHGRSRGLGGGRSSPPKPGGRMTIVSFPPAVRVRKLLSDLTDGVLLRNCVFEAILQPTWRGLTLSPNETLE